MTIAIDPETPFTYVCKEDRPLPAGDQTQWKLKALTLREEKQCTDALSRNGYDGAVLILKLGLVGWENFPDGKGGAIEFEKDSKHSGPSDRVLEKIPLSVRSELAQQIQAAGRLDEDERGK